MAHMYGLAYGVSESIIYVMYAITFYLGAILIDTGETTPLNVYRYFSDTEKIKLVLGFAIIAM